MHSLRGFAANEFWRGARWAEVHLAPPGAVAELEALDDLRAAMDIEPIDESMLPVCAELFQKTFNGPPWNEAWRPVDVNQRLADCYHTPHFYGLAAMEAGTLLGFALGHSESYNRQRHFLLQEVCVAPHLQRAGIGTHLMERLVVDLSGMDVSRIYLLTARDGSAEAFYRKLGFYVSPKMIVMSRRFSE